MSIRGGKHMDIRLEHALRSPEYEYYVKQKNKCGYYIGDFGFRTVMDFLNAAIDSQECGCALCGKHEPYKPGKRKRKRGVGWRYFELDHDHLLTGMDSIRGYLCPDCNSFLKPYDAIKDEKERQEFAKQWYGPKILDYLMNHPFQRFLRNRVSL